MALTTPRYPDLWILNPVKCFPTLTPKVKAEFWTTEIALMISHNHILSLKDVVPNNRTHPHPSLVTEPRFMMTVHITDQHPPLLTMADRRPTEIIVHLNGSIPCLLVADDHVLQLDLEKNINGLCVITALIIAQSILVSLSRNIHTHTCI
jgi:hypothetical protein